MLKLRAEVEELQTQYERIKLQMSRKGSSSVKQRPINSCLGIRCERGRIQSLHQDRYALTNGLMAMRMVTELAQFAMPTRSVSVDIRHPVVLIFWLGPERTKGV